MALPAQTTGALGWQLWVKVTFPHGRQCVHGCAGTALGLCSGKGNKGSFKQALHDHWRALGVTISFKRHYNHPHLEPGSTSLNPGYNKRVDDF